MLMLDANAGSILQIEPDGLNWVIGFELVSAVNNANCFGSIVDD